MALTPQQETRIAQAIVSNFQASGMNPDAMIQQLVKLLLKPRSAQLTQLQALAGSVLTSIDDAIATSAARASEELAALQANKAALEAALTGLAGS